MTLIFKQIFALLKVLNSDTGEKQIAWGLACGLVMGFAPAFSLQTLLIFILIFTFRIQIGAAFVSAFFFSLVAYIFDPLFHVIGASILEMDGLKAIFTIMYNLPILPFTKFYNSVVMGAGAVSLVLFPFAYLISKKMILKYRITVVARLEKTKFWKAIKATSFYKWYAKYDSLYGR